MESNHAFEMIKEDAIVAVMRGDFLPDVALETASALMKHGIRSFELTTNSVEPIAAMQALKREFGDDACVGMGTILDVATAQQALEAGADFIVSPAFQPEVVKAVLDAGVLIAPGVITPSEAVAAWQLGVPLLKLFPIGSLGVDYFKTLAGPLNHMSFMCNGSMDADNIGEFLKAGAIACGVGSWLTGNGHSSIDVIETRARQVRAVVDAARGVPKTV